MRSCAPAAFAVDVGCAHLPVPRRPCCAGVGVGCLLDEYATFTGKSGQHLPLPLISSAKFGLVVLAEASAKACGS